MTEEFYKSINKTYKLIEEITVGTEFSKLDRKMFKLETERFMMFLIASSKVVTDEDAALLNEYLFKDRKTEEIQNAVTSDPVYVSKFMEEIPLSLEMLVAFDKIAAKANKINELFSRSEEFIDFYKLIGEEIVSMENKPHNEDKKNLAIYIKALEKYRIEHLM